MDELKTRFARAHAKLRTLAVTGTNGKTTSVSMIYEAVRAAGEVPARLTTLGAWVDEEQIIGEDKTREFLGCVEKAVERGAKTLALEVTSKALAQGLAKRWPAHVAVFTNLSRDHLDMHESPEAYLAAKAQLFIHVAPGGTVVLNADDPSSELIASVVPDHARIRTFGTGGDLEAKNVRVDREGTRFDLGDEPYQLKLYGAVHVANALGALLALEAGGYSRRDVRAGIEGFAGVRGRFEVVVHEPFVVVDYAHTPDGLRGTLETARAIAATTNGRVHVVFGCGGRRDRGKRPQMGAVADAMSDRVVLTSDNPRDESPEAIALDVTRGLEPSVPWVQELDRRRAIALALEDAAPQDVVVIAGKGHETEQELAGRTVPFDDAAVVRELAGLIG